MPTCKFYRDEAPIDPADPDGDWHEEACEIEYRKTADGIWPTRDHPGAAPEYEIESVTGLLSGKPVTLTPAEESRAYEKIAEDYEN